MAANNSSNKRLGSTASVNCPIRLNGQMDDTNLSKMVRQQVDVKYSNNKITSVVNQKSTRYTDQNRYPYYWNEVDFQWPENRNTPGSISGTIKLTPSKTFETNSEELDDATLNISGVKYNSTSNSKSEREDNITVTVTIPKNESAGDYIGGTYTFKTDMLGTSGFDSHIRGAFQSSYNEVNPSAVLTLSNGHKELSFYDKKDGIVKSLPMSFSYTGDSGWPSIGVKCVSNQPSITFGDISGSLTLSGGQQVNGLLPSQRGWVYKASNNGKGFVTTASDKSNSHTSDRKLTVDYRFITYNSTPKLDQSGTITFNQKGGDVTVNDPSLTYEWYIKPDNYSYYVSMSVPENTITANRDDGKTQNFSYKNLCYLTPTKNNDGLVASVEDANVQVFSKNSIVSYQYDPINEYANYGDRIGEFQLQGKTVGCNLGVNTSSHDFTLYCDVKGNYCTNFNVSPKTSSVGFTIPGTNHDIQPKITVQYKITPVDENNKEIVKHSALPGTNSFPSFEISPDNGKSWYNSQFDIDYISTIGGLMNFCRNKFQYQFGDNTPAPSTAKSSGFLAKPEFRNDGSTYTPVVKLPTTDTNVYEGHTYYIRLRQSNEEPFEFKSVEYPIVPDYKWKVSASIIDKNEFTGTVKLNTTDIYALQKGSRGKVANGAESSIKYTITVPTFCYIVTSGKTSLDVVFNNDNKDKDIGYPIILLSNRYTLSSWQNDGSLVGYDLYFVANGSTPYDASTDNITVTGNASNGIYADGKKSSSYSTSISIGKEPIKGRIKIISLTNITQITSNLGTIIYNSDTTEDVFLNWEGCYNVSVKQNLNNKKDIDFTITLDDEGKKLSAEGGTVSGSIDSIKKTCSAGANTTGTISFALSGTNDDSAKYKGSTLSTYTFSKPQTGQAEEDITPKLTWRFKDDTTEHDITIDSDTKKWSFTVGNNIGSAAVVDKVEYADPNGNHNTDLFSNPFKVTVKASQNVATDKTIEILLYTYDKNNKKISSKGVKKTKVQGSSNGGSTTSATQYFSWTNQTNCSGKTGLSVTTTSNATGPAVTRSDITITGSDGYRWFDTMPTDGKKKDDVEISFNKTKSTTNLSWFSISDDTYSETVTITSSGITNNICQISFPWSLELYPNGYTNLKSKYSDTSSNGKLKEVYTSCSIDNSKWTVFTSSSDITNKKTGLSMSTDDSSFSFNYYGKIYDSNGTNLSTISLTRSFVLKGVTYHEEFKISSCSIDLGMTGSTLTAWDANPTIPSSISWTCVLQKRTYYIDTYDNSIHNDSGWVNSDTKYGDITYSHNLGSTLTVPGGSSATSKGSVTFTATITIKNEYKYNNSNTYSKSVTFYRYGKTYYNS